MPVNTEQIDTILQYALLVAGSLDNRIERGLGPIHLIKYVYLADLAFAEHHQGKTLTGVRWQFHKFGPWSQEVNARIEGALNQIYATRMEFKSDYGKDDWYRWCIECGDLLEEKERQVPLMARLRLSKEISKFSNDTPSLLDHVYKTEPMLSAKPGEYLNFESVYSDTRSILAPEPTKYSLLSMKKKKHLANRMMELKQSKKVEQKRMLVCPVADPRYDDVYDQGVRWLDSLAGPEFSDMTLDAHFSDDVWNSMTRKGYDLSR